MCITKYSFLITLVIFSLVFFWYANADSSEQQDHLIDINNDESDEIIDIFQDASDYPFAINERASLRPVIGKRASLRPFGKRASLRPVGRRASLRPFGKRASLRPVGKRASLRPPKYMGKRKQQGIQY